MLGDDQKDKQMQRGQFISLGLMVALVLVWSFFFLPRATEQPAGQTPPTASQTPGDTSLSSVGGTVPPVALTTPAAPEDVEGLPPVAAPANPAEDEIVLGDEFLDLTFTRVGGRLKQADVILGENGKDSVKLVPINPDTPDAELVYPLGLRFSSNYLGDALDRRRWDAEKAEDGRGVTFTLELPEQGARVVKRFALAEATHVLDVEVRYENLSQEPRILGLDTTEAAFALTWGPDVTSHDKTKGVHQQIVWSQVDGLKHLETHKLEAPATARGYSDRETTAAWMAIKSAYFAIAVKPEFENADYWVSGVEGNFSIGVGAPRTEVPAGKALTQNYQVYVGPTKMETLAKAWPGLQSVQEFFTWFSIMDSFAKLLLGVLNWFHGSVIANYGLAIIFLTVLVRMVVFPLTWKSMKSMKKMQKLQPEMEALREEYKDDQQELNKKMMELYSERGVNPLGGCFPVLIQMPVFIALYRMLWSAFELRGEPFFGWITDLSEPDHLLTLPFTIPFPMQPIETFNLLPILMAGAMVVSTKIMPTSGPVTNPQQKMMMNIMPVFFSIICYNMASGLNLYILTSTLLGIAQNYAVSKADINVDISKKPKSKTATRSKHFYTAAQQRKREVAKEAKRDRSDTPKKKDGDSARKKKSRS